MKLGPVTKLDKGNTTPLKNDDDFMAENCDVICQFFDLWPILGILEAGFQTHGL